MFRLIRFLFLLVITLLVTLYLLLLFVDLNHFKENEIVQKTASFQKISLNNFLSDETNEIFDLDSRNIQIFDANLEKVAEYLSTKNILKILRNI